MSFARRLPVDFSPFQGIKTSFPHPFPHLWKSSGKAAAFLEIFHRAEHEDPFRKRLCPVGTSCVTSVENPLKIVEKWQQKRLFPKNGTEWHVEKAVEIAEKPQKSKKCPFGWIFKEGAILSHNCSTPQSTAFQQGFPRLRKSKALVLQGDFEFSTVSPGLITTITIFILSIFISLLRAQRGRHQTKGTNPNESYL